MGSYLSEPITEKNSHDEFSPKLQCGYSSMQGWRISQEDAHNALLQFDDDTAFFGVYDGHGGHEVAEYCSIHLPDFLKTLESYQHGDVETALKEAFLGFDQTIAKPQVVAMLKEMAKDSNAADESDEDEESVQNLCKEAEMPIEEVMEKYAHFKHPFQHVKDDVKVPVSPMLKAKGAHDAGASGSGASSARPTERMDASGDAKPTAENQENGHASPEMKTSESNEAETPNNIAAQNTNGATPKRGKALTKTKGVETKAAPEVAEMKSKRPKRSVSEMYAKLLDIHTADLESEEDEEEDDKTFEGPEDSSSDDDDDDDEEEFSGMTEEDESSNFEEEDDDDEDDELRSNEADDTASLEFAKNMVEEPGSDSGCTAVVALLKGDTLFVANAGDSRCIVCRSGRAIEMSFDHKPEDALERERIVKAGGRVTADGRVNGGLNLSRAIGDHAYKQNKQMSDREQMITALPDIKTLKIDMQTDEFMVLACDGIWNFMSSQEVVDFVRPEMVDGEPLSKICERMFDHCLAPNTLGDGTGCDNMTAIIVKFNASASLKRTATSDVEGADENTKRCKTDDDDESATSRA